MLRAISEIVSLLVKAHDRGEQINLTKLKKRVAAKYKTAGMPKIVDILAALPESHKD